jgi:plasmid stability protein
MASMSIAALTAMLHMQQWFALEKVMAALTVRNLDPAIVRSLRIRAAEEGLSAEEMHRQILAQALQPAPTSAEIVRAFRRLGDLGLKIERDERTDPGRPPLEL